MKNINRTFFDYIACADNEKVHSQTIGWLLSNNCKALNAEQKSSFLRKITNEDDKNFEIEEVWMERANIDILVLCKNDIIVIENKIKASESESQLNKYEEILENGDLSNLNENRNKPIYIFLTLDGESASHHGYKNVAYEELLNTLVECTNNHFSTDNSLLQEYHQNIDQLRDSFILQEYIKTIKQLLRILGHMKNCGNDDLSKSIRKWVFSNLKARKYDLHRLENQNDEELKTYILENGLIRQMQKTYFKSVMGHFCSLIDDTVDMKKDNYSAHYSNSPNNGEGLIDVALMKHKYLYNDTEFIFGFQIQGSIVKINTRALKYWESNRNQLPPDTKEKMNQLKIGLGYEKCKSGTTKAYYSIIKNLGKSVGEYNPKELADYLVEQIQITEPKIREVFGIN
jgi:hypothetical protein